MFYGPGPRVVILLGVAIILFFVVLLIAPLFSTATSKYDGWQNTPDVSQ